MSKHSLDLLSMRCVKCRTPLTSIIWEGASCVSDWVDRRIIEQNLPNAVAENTPPEPSKEKCVCATGKYCLAEKHWQEPEGENPFHKWGTFDITRRSWDCDLCGYELYEKSCKTQTLPDGRTKVTSLFKIPKCPGEKK